jgi:hypothetical protein
MLALQCPFCEHGNPGDARYCNGCGSRLHLKGCNRCGAVNDQIVGQCYQCGAVFPELTDAPEAAARAACEKLQKLLRSEPSVVPVPDVAAATPAAAVRPIPGHAPSDESVARRREADGRRAGRRTAKTAAMLSMVALSGGVVYAYYLYFHSASPAERIGTGYRNPPAATAATDRKLNGITSSVVPERNAVSPLPVGPGATSTSGIEALGVARPTGSPVDAANLPMSQGGARVNQPDEIERASPTPAPGRAEGPARSIAAMKDAASPAPPSAPRAKGAGEAAHDVSPPRVQEPRDPGLRSETRGARTDPAVNRSTGVESSAILMPRSRARQHDTPTNPPASLCTEAVAAAGLCTPTSPEEGK